MQEINGFEIDIFNQYDLQENVKTSTCPLCSVERKKSTQKCAMVDWKRGLLTCQHCGETLQLHTFKKKTSEKDFIKPFVKSAEMYNLPLSEKLISWFENKRKISKSTLSKMRITEGLEFMPQTGNNQNTIQFNYFKNDEVVNIKFRDGAKNFKLFKGAEKIFYNFDFCRLSDDIVIVEGEIDCLSYVESGILHCVSTPNGSTLNTVNLDYLDNSIEIFENKKRIFLALDNDAPGINVTKELIRRLGAERCFNVDLKDCNDPNEYLIKYGKEELKNTIKNAKPIPLENVLTMADEEQNLYDFYLNGLAKGLTCGMKSLDSVYSILTGYYEVITGIPTHGKSEVVDSRVIGLNLNYGYKCAFVSIENKPTFLHLDKITKKIAGYKPKTQAEIDSPIFQNAVRHVKENFFFVDFEGSYDLEKVLNKIKELIIRKGIRTFVLDPFNKIRYKGEIINTTGNRVNDYTSTYLIKIDEFCRKYDVIGILVPHPVKMKKENGKYEFPDFYQIKGGGEFYDMSNFGLSVYRDFESKTTKIKVLKCKFAHLGENNAEVEYSYNVNNGRYTELKYTNSMGIEIDEVRFDNSSWLEIEEKENINIEISASTDFDLARVEDGDDIPF